MSLSFSSRADVFIPKPGPQAAATEQDCPPNNPVQAFVKPARVVVHPLDSPEEPSVELRNVLVLMSPRGQPDMIQLSSVAPAKMDILRDTALAIINFGPPVSAEVMVSTTFIELPHGQPALWLTRDLASLAFDDNEEDACIDDLCMNAALANLAQSPQPACSSFSQENAEYYCPVASTFRGGDEQIDGLSSDDDESSTSPGGGTCADGNQSLTHHDAKEVDEPKSKNHCAPHGSALAPRHQVNSL